jgi:CarD family transcriptional regulator
MSRNNWTKAGIFVANLLQGVSRSGCARIREGDLLDASAEQPIRLCGFGPLALSRTSSERLKHMASSALDFIVGDYVVYPKHGVGRVIELQNSEIAGMSLELYVLRFEKEKMTLRVPTNKAESVGMRKLSSDKQMQEALQTLKGKPKVKRTMWSRRAQEYEAKINSGDLVSIAEVVRDLFRAEDQPEQSYSERQIFEAACSRLARELAAMEQVDEPTAVQKLIEILKKAAEIYNKSSVPVDA